MTDRCGRHPLRTTVLLVHPGRRARALGVEWSFYAAELRHLEVVARYVAGDWDGSLAAAGELARVPEMAAHVCAAGLLVQVGRGDPAVGQRRARARGLTARLDAHVLLMLATVAAEVELAGQAGEPEVALERCGWAVRRLRELWDVDRLAVLRLVATAVAPVADAAAAARPAGNGPVVNRWVVGGA